MKTLRKCQCGAKPQIVEVATVRAMRPRRGHMRDNVRERAQCPFCGNATAAHAHRADLRREWNSAGWCGQAEVISDPAGVAGILATRLPMTDYVLLDEVSGDSAIVAAEMRRIRAHTDAFAGLSCVPANIDDLPPHQWGDPRFDMSIPSTPRDHNSPFNTLDKTEGGAK
mgnify:CR=1 FL=1